MRRLALPLPLLVVFLTACNGNTSETLTALGISGEREWHGHLMLGPQAQVFRACGQTEQWQLDIRDELAEPLNHAYQRAVMEPYEEAYLSIKASPQQGNALHISQLLELRARENDDCR